MEDKEIRAADYWMFIKYFANDSETYYKDMAIAELVDRIEHIVFGMFLYRALDSWNWRHQHSQLDVYTYLFFFLWPLDRGIQGDTHWLLIHWQMAEKGLKGLSDKETLWKRSL